MRDAWRRRMSHVLTMTSINVIQDLGREEINCEETPERIQYCTTIPCLGKWVYDLKPIFLLVSWYYPESSA
jgi:hypothetical protein